MHLYTIGHSTRSLKEFLALLREHELTAFAEIREGVLLYPEPRQVRTRSSKEG